MQPPLVVIGLSARMLAASAARAGIRPIAIDLFADRDTREIAHCVALPSFEDQHVLPVLEKAAEEKGRLLLVYGSGIDTRPDLVEQISGIVELTGNSPSALRIVNRPETFFGLLDSLAIPHPQTIFKRPDDPANWLFKIPFTEGGRGIFSGTDHPDIKSGYYQREINGPAMSALFLANRMDARIVGFNTQWTVDGHAYLPYQFAGIMNCAELSPLQKRQIGDYATNLAQSLSLAGLNSLDFLVEDGQCKVLELNPRPGASMMLYDDRFPFGLLAEHVRGFEGVQIRRPNSVRPVCHGLEVVYAKQSCGIGEDLHWPDWTVDRPMAGTKISAGDPLCTVTANATCGTALRSILSQRKQRILDLSSGRAMQLV